MIPENVSQGSLNKGYLIRLAWARRSAKCSLWFLKNMHNHVKVLRRLQWGVGKPIELHLQLTN